MLNQIKERPGLFISYRSYHYHNISKDTIIKILRFDKYWVSKGYKQWTFSEYWICKKFDNFYLEDQHFIPGGKFRFSRLSEIFVFMNARIRYRYERREH